MTENAATTLLFTTTVSRFYDFYSYRDEFLDLIREMDFNVRRMLKSDSKQEEKMIKEHVNYVNKLTISFWACALITANSMCANAMVEWIKGEDDQKALPMILRSWLPISQTWDNFSIFYALHFYVMWVGMLIVPCWHAFIAALMVYVILELKLLQNRLQNLKDYLRPNYTDEEIYQFLVECIKKQISTKSFVTRLLDLIKRSVFLDFVIYSALICALLYDAASRKNSVVVVFITICYILTMCLILWLYHWHANLISLNVSLFLLSLQLHKA